MVFLVTGRAGAGKTTTARVVAASFRHRGQPTLILDGDEVRDLLPTGFSEGERRAHVRRMAAFASIAEKQGIVVIIACVSPTKAIRQIVRDMCQEVHLLYIKGGQLWENSTYEEPDDDEYSHSR